MPRRTKLSIEDIVCIEALLKLRLSISKIAKRLDRSWGCIRNYVRRRVDPTIQGSSTADKPIVSTSTDQDSPSTADNPVVSTPTNQDSSSSIDGQPIVSNLTTQVMQDLSTVGEPIVSTPTDQAMQDLSTAVEPIASTFTDLNC